METTRLQLVLSKPLPVPDTGHFSGNGTSATQNITLILAAAFMLFIVVGALVFAILRKKGKFSAETKSKMSLSRTKKILRGGGLMLFILVGLGLLANMTQNNMQDSHAIDDYAEINVPEKVEIEGEISESTFMVGEVDIEKLDATKHGYNIYARADDVRNFVPETEDNETLISPILEQGVALGVNTWGYTFEADAKAEDEVWHSLTDAEAWIKSYEEATEAGKVTKVYFGVLTDENAVADTYNLDVYFYSIANLARNFEEAFGAAGVSKYEDTGYYAMQSMTPEICEDIVKPSMIDAEVPEIKLIDKRDESVYWVAKLADGKCWMTQNLDLLIDPSTEYTHADTDLGWTNWDESATWIPRSTLMPIATIDDADDPAADVDMEDGDIASVAYAVNNWMNDRDYPYQLEGGDQYNGNEPLAYCTNKGFTEAECDHFKTGNSYNWSAAVATNDTSAVTANYADMPNSICPAGWRLSKGIVLMGGINQPSEFNMLLYTHGVVSELATAADGNMSTDSENGHKLGMAPLYFARTGQVSNGYLDWSGTNGYYWTGTAYSYMYAYLMSFGWSNNNDRVTSLSVARSSGRVYGRSVRCVAR